MVSVMFPSPKGGGPIEALRVDQETGGLNWTVSIAERRWPH